MSFCPQCCHSLRGLAGVPSETHGRFEAAVRCPECAFEVPRGARVVVGSADATGVGGRISRGAIIGYLSLTVFLAPQLLGFVRGLAQDPSLAFLSRSFGTLALIGILCLTGYSLFAGIFNISGVSEPAEITARIRRKSRWLVRPGMIEVFVAGFGSDPRRRSGGSEVGGVIVQEIDASSLRTILSMEVPARRGVRGRVLDLTARRDGQGGVAASMFVVTAATAAQFANDLLETARDAQAVDCPLPLESVAPPPLPNPDPSEPVSHVGVDQIVISGSPFEPRLLADARGTMAATPRMAVIGMVLLVCGIACVVLGDRGTQFIGGLVFFLGLSTSVGWIYARYRSSPSRWIASPGVLRIESYTRIVPLFGPKVRTIRAARFGSVQAAERHGVPVLEARKAGARRPSAILVPDEWRGREPAALAAAIELIVRRSA